MIATENQTVRIVDGKVFVDDAPVNDSFVPLEYRGHDDYGPVVIPEGSTSSWVITARGVPTAATGGMSPEVPMGRVRCAGGRCLTHELSDRNSTVKR